MADYTEASRLCYVTMKPGHPLVKQHIRAGGQAFVLEEGMNGHMITIYDQGKHMPLLWTHLIPATLQGRALHNVQNAMFAAALAYNLNLSLDDIRQGLRTFDATYFQAPGRMNVFDDHPFKVIMDYAHNPVAVRAMCSVVDHFEVEGRRLLVLSAPGDRRDQDIQEIADIAAGHFDHFICRCDDHRRGRGPDEVAQMLKARLIEKGVSEDRIDVIPDESASIEHALNMAAPGDLVLVLADKIKRSWKQIVQFKPHVGHAPAVRRAETIVVPDIEGFSLDANIALVSDERGVRIAREDAD
jgi:cyanophycin synthetase